MIDYAEAAERIIEAYSRVARWAARDFKRSNAPAHLTATQFAILGLAVSGQQSTVSQVAGQLDLSVPTVVRAVDALERKGLVARQRSTSDGRSVTITCTEAGRTVREALEHSRRERLVRLLRGMNEEDITGLVRGFDAMAAATEPPVRRLRKEVNGEPRAG